MSYTKVKSSCGRAMYSHGACDMEDTRCRVPRTCTASGTLLCGDVRPHLVLVQLNPPLRDQNFSFTGHFVANPATNFAKKRNKKTRHLHSNAGCIVNWHPLKLCCHLKKKTSTIQRHSGARSFCASCRTKAISVKIT